MKSNWQKCALDVDNLFNLPSLHYRCLRYCHTVITLSCKLISFGKHICCFVHYIVVRCPSVAYRKCPLTDIGVDTQTCFLSWEWPLMFSVSHKSFTDIAPLSCCSI